MNDDKKIKMQKILEASDNKLPFIELYVTTTNHKNKNAFVFMNKFMNNIKESIKMYNLCIDYLDHMCPGEPKEYKIHVSLKKELINYTPYYYLYLIKDMIYIHHIVLLSFFKPRIFFF